MKFVEYQPHESQINMSSIPGIFLLGLVFAYQKEKVFSFPGIFLLGLVFAYQKEKVFSFLIAIITDGDDPSLLNAEERKGRAKRASRRMDQCYSFRE